MLTFTSVYLDSPPVQGRAVDLWIPEREVVQPVVLFFVHGGGWRQGQRDQMHALMHAFYERGYVCISVDYRLGGATVGVQLADVREGMALAAAHLRDRGIDRPFVLYGSSAGGHLALLAGLAPAGACGEIFDGPQPAISGIVACCAPVTFEPWEDIFPGSWDAMRQAVGQPYESSPESYARVSPDRHATAGSPPILFLMGESEHMFPNALTIALADRLRSLGGVAECHVYPAAEHGFFYALERRPQRMAFADMLAFLERLPL